MNSPLLSGLPRDNKKPHLFSMRRGFCSPVRISIPHPCSGWEHSTVSTCIETRGAPLRLAVFPFTARFSQVFLDAFSLQGCPETVRFASLLHILALSLSNPCFCTIHASLLSLEGFVRLRGINTSNGGREYRKNPLLCQIFLSLRFIMPRKVLSGVPLGGSRLSGRRPLSH
jgi:hypothetical protein